ncbi:MAG: phosphoglycerate kinase [Verrucomicrobiales bacterium]|nr:phosphoglycerate kinase [Verrucomicrobiales bacterium]MCP5526965.1 phosphoglycerate kinase [Verrucomicrobiales bacterium]
MAKLTINDVDFGGRRVLVRVDYNVPLKEKDGRMVITDTTRIEATLPTLQHLIGQGARIILAAHLGRPKGRPEPSMSLRPVAGKLSELLGKPVAFVENSVGPAVSRAVDALQNGDVLLLENVRYHAEEEANDPAFADQLAAVAEAYVNDAFGTAHRAHASTEGVARLVAGRGGQCAAGLLMEKELKFLGDELEQPARPFVVILGGAKVSDKIKVINRLLEKADALLIGGAMAYTFRLAQGAPVGASLVEPDRVEDARAALAKAKERGVKLLIPVDDIVAAKVDSGEKDKKGRTIFKYENPRVTRAGIADNEAGLDIGPETAKLYAEVIASARAILWNGPMGLFEDDRFAAGTLAVGQAVAAATQSNGATSIIGGGDSVSALKKAGLGDQVTWMSTGGGASLEFLEGIELPGVAALSEK